jgi:hypothetical protein
MALGPFDRRGEGLTHMYPHMRRSLEDTKRPNCRFTIIHLGPVSERPSVRPDQLLLEVTSYSSK